MKLEAIRSIAMCNHALQVGGQVDDVDGVERTFLRADTTTDAERLGNEGDPGLRSDFDAELAAAYNGAGLFALEPTFLAAC
jgi:hypothetical protein